jgi:integrase
MSVIKNEHGVYVVRRAVPAPLRAAVADVLRNGKPQQRFLQKSLRTKDAAVAKRRAPPVLQHFDAVLEKAKALTVARPVRTTLRPAEITEIADRMFASVLMQDERWRFGGKEYLRQAEEWMKREGVWYEDTKPMFPLDTLPDYGISDEQLRHANEGTVEELEYCRGALARGDISYVADDLDMLLLDCPFDVDRKGAAYRELGIAALKATVRAWEAIQRRDAGESVDTPKLPALGTQAPPSGDTLRAAFEGWKKARNPSPRTLQEYERALNLFTELHGDLPVAAITKPHARTFREHLQDIPRQRTGDLLKAPLPVLAEYGRAHPDVPKITTTTVNKLMGGLQAISVWARDQGVIPDEVVWSDPFSRMRLEEDESEREPFTISELQKLFASPVFTDEERPNGGRGEAAYWLPVLALFTGGRLSELSGLTAFDVLHEETAGHHVFSFTKDKARGRRLKNKSSARAVPVHPELERLGFLQYVDAVRSERGADAWLFPMVSPPHNSGAASWSKWFGRYLRSVGITDPNKVFHSFRHCFKDALRAGKVPEDLNDALAGHSYGGRVGRGYGAKDIVRRFGMERLTEAIRSVNYAGVHIPQNNNNTRSSSEK